MTARPSLQRNAYFNGIINNAQLQVELENIQNNILFIIPQTISFGVDKIVHTDLRKHILYSFGNEEGYYRILGSENDQVWIKGDVLVRQNRSNGKEERQCKIMFTESFHYGCHDQTREVQLVHVHMPLFGGVLTPVNVTEIPKKLLLKYTAMLRSMPEFEFVFNQILEFTQWVTATGGDFKSSSLQKIVCQQWRNSTKQIMHSDALNAIEIDLASWSDLVVPIRQVVESALMEQLHPLIFSQYVERFRTEEQTLRSKFHKMRLYTQQDFHIRESLHCDQDLAIEELRRLPMLTTPLDLLLCLKNCISKVAQGTHVVSSFTVAQHVTTDILLDQLLFVILQASNGGATNFNFYANLAYIADYHFMPVHTTVLGYALANFQIAIDWFSSNNLDKLPTSCIAKANESILSFQNLPINKQVNPLSTTDNHELKSRMIGRNFCNTKQWNDIIQQIGGCLKVAFSDKLNLILSTSQDLYFWKESCLQTISVQTKVSSVACGAMHSLFCDINGYVYSIGNGSRGQLGLRSSALNMVAYTTESKQLDVLTGTFITQVAAGDFYSVVLSSKGEVFSFGCGDRGQLGRTFSDTGHQAYFVPHRIEADWFRHQFYTQEAIPAITITKLYCGSDHSIAISYSGTAFTWGHGGHGRLGLGSNSDAKRPKEVLALTHADVHVVRACASKYDTVFLLKSGRMYACGENKFLHRNTATFVPTGVPFSHCIVEVSCDTSNLVAIDEFNRVFVWQAIDHDSFDSKEFKNPRHLGIVSPNCKLFCGTRGTIILNA